MALNINLGFRMNESPETLLKELILSPLIYIRLLGIICSIIVFGCIADKVDVEVNNDDVCLYNDSNACNFGIAVGVIGFVMCLVFLVKDVLYVVIDFSNNILVKKVVIIVDAAANGLWAFLWFVAFAYLADQWRRTDKTDFVISTPVTNCARSGVAFSFFSIFIWGAIVGVNIFFFVRVMKMGGSSPRQPGGYASFPEDEGAISDETGGGGGGDGGGTNYQPPQY